MIEINALLNPEIHNTTQRMYSEIFKVPLDTKYKTFENKLNL